MKPLELQKAIKKRNLSPLYFFYGEETFLIDKIVSEMKEKLVDPDLSSFNFNIFYGKESEPQDIINSAMTLPLMSDYRLVVVREADQIKSSSWKGFLSYFENPSSSTCCVFCAENMVLKAESLKAFRKRGETIRFYHPFEREVPEWIRKIANELNKKISREAVTLLSVELGNDLRKIYNELQKIAIYVGEKAVIESDDVKEAIADVRGITIFGLIDCIGVKDRESALHALRKLLEAGESPLGILTMITRQMRLLTRAKELLKEGSSHEEVGRTLNIRGFYLEGFLKQVREFSLYHVEACFTHLFCSDWKLKSSRINKQLIMEKLIADLCAL